MAIFNRVKSFWQGFALREGRFYPQRGELKLAVYVRTEGPTLRAAPKVLTIPYPARAGCLWKFYLSDSRNVNRFVTLESKR